MTQRSHRFDWVAYDAIFDKGNNVIAMAAGGTVLGSLAGFYGSLVGLAFGAVIGVRMPVPARDRRRERAPGPRPRR